MSVLYVKTLRGEVNEREGEREREREKGRVKIMVCMIFFVTAEDRQLLGWM